MGLIINLNDLSEDLVAFLGRQESQEIRSADTYVDDLADFAANGDRVYGQTLPWSKTHDHIRLNRGLLNIWAGVNGSGKSVLVGMVIMWLISKYRQSALIASLEMPPRQTLYRMACQSAMCKPGVDYARRWAQSLEGNLFIYDQLDSIASERILGLVHYSAKELGVDHVVIDSLVKCGLSRDDYAVQAKFVDRLQWAAKQYQINVHLVCHMRKGDDEKRSGGKFDVRGAAEITDLCDNLFILHRNKSKEQLQNKLDSNPNKLPTETEQAKLEQPDAFLKVEKNRWFGIEKNYGLWFDPSSQQYVPRDDRRPFEIYSPGGSHVRTSQMAEVS